MIRTFRSSALSQQPTQTQQKITNSQSARTNTVHRFLSFLSLLPRKHTSNGEKYRGHLLRLALALPLSEDQGLKTQISCTATKAQMHKKSFCFCVSLFPENCSKLLTSKKGKNCLLQTEQFQLNFSHFQGWKKIQIDPITKFLTNPLKSFLTLSFEEGV